MSITTGDIQLGWNKLTPGEICENWVELSDGTTLYCDQLATQAIRGETDSFGSEWLHYCDGCTDDLYREIWAQRKAESDARRIGTCPSCKQHKEDIDRYTDYDRDEWDREAWACQSCRAAFYKSVDDELEWLDEQRRAARYLPDDDDAPIEDYDEYLDEEDDGPIEV